MSCPVLSLVKQEQGGGQEGYRTSNECLTLLQRKADDVVVKIVFHNVFRINILMKLMKF